MRVLSTPNMGCLAARLALALLASAPVVGCGQEVSGSGSVTDSVTDVSVAGEPLGSAAQRARLTPQLLEVTPIVDPLGVGEAAEKKARGLIRSADEYRRLFGHAAPRGVDFAQGDIVIFYSAGTQPSGGYDASIPSVVQVARTLLVATHLHTPGPNCAVTLALTTPHALVKVRPIGRVAGARFSHMRSVRECEVDAPSCEGFECPRGERCELQDVVCIQAPCPPLPVCVADDEPEPDPCALVRCAGGTRCEVQAGQAVCVPVAGGGERCGNNVCGEGLVCCNASCGICTPPDGACIQIACL